LPSAFGERTQSPHKRMSLRKISEELAKQGHLNERGQPYNPKSILAMVDGAVVRQAHGGKP
jgi:hypothetical protein